MRSMDWLTCRFQPLLTSPDLLRQPRSPFMLVMLAELLPSPALIYERGRQELDFLVGSLANLRLTYCILFSSTLSAVISSCPRAEGNGVVLCAFQLPIGQEGLYVMQLRARRMPSARSHEQWRSPEAITPATRPFGTQKRHEMTIAAALAPFYV